MTAAGGIAIGLLLTASTASANLLAYEGFDYAAGTGNLVGLDGGTGWGGAWNTRPNVVGGGSSISNQGDILAGSLSYSDGVNSLLTTGGHSYMYGTSVGSFEPARALASTAGGADGTSLFVSFLINRVGAAQNPATTSPPNEYPRGANVRWWTDGGERGNIGNNSNATTDTVKLTSKDSALIDSGVQFSNTVNFVVGRIDFDTTNGNMLYLWVNPSLSVEDLGSALSTAYVDGANITHGGIDAISPFLGNDSSGRPPSEILFDELRIGTTYAAVTPVPEPATIAAILGLIAGTFVFIRRRRLMNG